MSARRSWYAGVVAASALAAAAAAAAGLPAALRAPLVLTFLLLGPGMAFVPLLALRDPIAELTLALVLSLALDALVAVTMLYVGAWSPVAILLVLAGLALAGAGLQRARVGGAP
ncbi:MAG: hypothetical protein QOI62_2946 [Solirubrobacteraceae bacterium]|jgi:hypothetical protein|nr:hypothetical protein [Solirubrobacteraceae bacterium]MEA2276606.1 hypothetical protein [Solirubrobacteraceae bacterium]MEA2359686.1 hypothetical protein [Solirubrobacteraceae bacterium]MEA2392557.1 hypothetical protein [Solirubrobacteraceae bacterium]